MVAVTFSPGCTEVALTVTVDGVGVPPPEPVTVMCELVATAAKVPAANSRRSYSPGVEEARKPDLGVAAPGRRFVVRSVQVFPLPVGVGGAAGIEEPGSSRRAPPGASEWSR